MIYGKIGTGVLSRVKEFFQKVASNNPSTNESLDVSDFGSDNPVLGRTDIQMGLGHPHTRQKGEMPNEHMKRRRLSERGAPVNQPKL
ncbi:MAG: hypothetical protein COB76_00350 [Alphaproteobacteria bacterium]|nr:MAG: hypothetical protein COB76_00350 [Alphaproteobacteria bacterium]